MLSGFIILVVAFRSIYRRVGYTLPLLFRFCEVWIHHLYILLYHGL